MCKLRLMATTALILLGTSPMLAADPAYVGTWSADATKCAVPQSMQDAPMMVRPDGYDQHEAHCTFASVKKIKTGWRVAAKCSVQGDAVAVSFTLSVEGNTLTMHEGKVPQRFRRCP